VIVVSDQFKVLTGAIFIMPNKRPDRRMKIFETFRAVPRAFGILLDILGYARSSFVIFPCPRTVTTRMLLPGSLSQRDVRVSLFL